MKDKPTNSPQSFSRRDFIKGAGASLALFTIVPRHVLGGVGYIPPSDRLNIAGVGVGGRGYDILKGAYNNGTENIVALCDVDDARAANTYKEYPNAKRYRDFRKMLEAQKDIDAVMIGTPDHTHAVIAMAAMQMGKHVYVEKPLTHNIREARMLTEAARRYKVATQMGNQGNSSEDIRKIAEWIQGGVIGEVRTVQAWTNRPIWPQGKPVPKGGEKIPATLDWDLWLGPAAMRPYSPEYLPFKWRGWWDFGTGALGDMACHIIDPVFMALKLGYPTSVEASVSSVFIDDFKMGEFPESCPPSSIIHLEFPAREGMPPVSLHWYDGGLMPQRPTELKDNEQMGDWGGGVIFEGTRGKIMCGTYARNPTLLPTSAMNYFKQPEPTIPRVQGNHQTSWVAACKAGSIEAANKLASSNFDYAGPLTETVLMGNLALRSLNVKEMVKGADGRETAVYTGKKKLLWDGVNMRITNYEPANQFVGREYRSGWEIKG
jgi:predicted dehydrogenase